MSPSYPFKKFTLANSLQLVTKTYLMRCYFMIFYDISDETIESFLNGTERNLIIEQPNSRSLSSCLHFCEDKECQWRR